MAHEQTFSDDDPYLAELRAHCVAFPESVEKVAWGRPTFRAGKKLFAIFMGTDEHPWSVIFKPDDEDRLAFEQDDRFFVPPYWGPSGWLALDFDAAPVDWGEVDELLDGSYRQVALKRMIKALDEGLED